MNKKPFLVFLLVLFSILTACRVAGEIQGTNNTNEVAPTAEDIEPTEIEPTETEETLPPTESPTATADPYAGWSTYVNQDQGYQFKFPAGATVQSFGIQSYPTNDLPAGMDPETYIAQLQQTHGDHLCVVVQYELGYVNFSAPVNNEFAYALCGRTGVGAGQITNISELVNINGNQETANGMEFYGGAESLDMHNQTLVIRLADLTRIEYGASPNAAFSYADYLAGTKNTLLMIVSSYQPYP